MSSLSEPNEPSLDTPRAKNLALILLAMTQFVIVIDAAIVNVALPNASPTPPTGPELRVRRPGGLRRAGCARPGSR